MGHSLFVRRLISAVDMSEFFGRFVAVLLFLFLFLVCCNMDKREEQRSVIKFMQKSGATPTQFYACYPC